MDIKKKYIDLTSEERLKNTFELYKSFSKVIEKKFNEKDLTKKFNEADEAIHYANMAIILLNLLSLHIALIGKENKMEEMCDNTSICIMNFTKFYCAVLEKMAME